MTDDTPEPAPNPASSPVAVRLAQVRKVVLGLVAAAVLIVVPVAVRATVEVATLGNKLFQDGEPWKLIKEDPEAARDLVTVCMNLARTAAVMLAPVVPSFAQTVYRIFGLSPKGPQSFAEGGAFDLVEREVVVDMRAESTDDGD